MATAKQHPLQRSWDALLILHWRRDNKFMALSIHCKQMFGKYPEELGKEGMLRCSAFAFPTTQVRVWVDTNLHPLGIKLWDIEDNKRVLDWCNASTGLDCVVSRKVKRWQDEGTKKSHQSHLGMQASKLSYDLERTGNRMNSPNQVKATGRGKKMGRLR
jgi:hypothetical protein